MSSRSVGSLIVNVGANTRPLTAGLQQAQKQVRTFGTQVGASARSARSAFNSMGHAGGQMLGRLRGLPVVGGLLSMGGIASSVGSAFTGAAGQAAQYSPQVSLIQQRMQRHQMRQGMALGGKSPMASYLLSGGIATVLGQAAMNMAGESSLFDPSTRLGFALEHPGTALSLLDVGMEQFQSNIPGGYNPNDLAIDFLQEYLGHVKDILKEISPYGENRRAQGVEP